MLKVVKQNTQKDTVFAKLGEKQSVSWLVDIENGKVQEWIALIWNHRISFTSAFAKKQGFKLPAKEELKFKVNTLKGTDVEIRYVIHHDKAIGFQLRKAGTQRWSQLFVFESVIAK